MFEKILQTEETIELQEECAYCGKGALASIKMGHAVLTNRRLIICKKKYTPLMIIITVALFVIIYIGIALTTGLLLGALPGAFLGAGCAVAGTAISKLFSKKPEESPTNTEFSFNREDITSLEDGNRGVRQMIVIKTKNGDICKISPKDKAAWRTALKL